MPPAVDSLTKFQASSKAPAQWHSQTETNLSMAFRAHKFADEQFTASTLGHTHTWEDNLSQYQSVHQNLCKKVGTTRQLRDLLHDRIRSMAKTIDETGHTLQALETAGTAKDEPLSLCRWRMEQRAQRPERELIRDTFEIALEKEWEILSTVSDRLQHQITKTQATVRTLTEWKNELEDDHESKVLSLETDEQCLNTAHRTWPAKGKPRMDRTLLAAGADVARGSGHVPVKMPSLPADDPSHSINAVRNANEEERRQSETLQRIAQARDAEKSASGLREESARIIGMIRKDCALVSKKAEEACARRIDETQTMKKKLEWTIEETERKIQSISESMSKTGANLRAHQEPASLITSREKFRNERKGTERGGDNVVTAMDKQKYRLRRNQKHLEQNHADEEGTLRTLEDAKMQLMADLSDKDKALQIDLRCQSWRHILGGTPPKVGPPPPKVG